MHVCMYPFSVFICYNILKWDSLIFSIFVKNRKILLIILLLVFIILILLNMLILILILIGLASN